MAATVSISKLTQLPSSSFISKQQLVKTGRVPVPQNRSRYPVLFMRQHQQSQWNPSILKSDTPVLVVFYTSWCEPCQVVHKVVDEIVTDYAGKLKCVSVNVEEEPRVAEEYDIKAVPIVLLFKNGRKCESVAGTMSKHFFVAAVEKLLAA